MTGGGLDDHRRAIDRIDAEIAHLLARRVRRAKLAAASRSGTADDPGRDPDREAEIVDRVREILEAQGAGGEYDVERIYDAVFEATRGRPFDVEGGFEAREHLPVGSPVAVDRKAGEVFVRRPRPEAGDDDE